jgi:hypothetical protein
VPGALTPIALALRPALRAGSAAARAGSAPSTVSALGAAGTAALAAATERAWLAAWGTLPSALDALEGAPAAARAAVTRAQERLACGLTDALALAVARRDVRGASALLWGWAAADLGVPSDAAALAPAAASLLPALTSLASAPALGAAASDDTLVGEEGAGAGAGGAAARLWAPWDVPTLAARLVAGELAPADALAHLAEAPPRRALPAVVGTGAFARPSGAEFLAPLIGKGEAAAEAGAPPPPPPPPPPRAALEGLAASLGLARVLELYAA